MSPEVYQFFSVPTGAPNKGNRKLFPMCLQHCDPYKGIQWKVLDIVEE
jgi:hypothetical protein